VLLIALMMDAAFIPAEGGQNSGTQPYLQSPPREQQISMLKLTTLKRIKGFLNQ
jgi:hypothetical protein